MESTGRAESLAAPAPAGGPPPGLRAYSVGAEVPAHVRRLHLNEFRYPHPPAVLAALGEAVAPGEGAGDLLARYQAGPDPALLGALARYTGAPGPEHLVLAPGSDEALRAVIDLCGHRGHRAVLMGVPGYTHFEHYVRLRGMDLVTWAMGIEPDEPGHEEALRYHDPLLRSGCLVYLCSPNNPTGTMWSWEAVERLSLDYPLSVFLLDEAYIEFASAWKAKIPDSHWEGLDRPGEIEMASAAFNLRSLARLAWGSPNIVVTRTMSKAFGLASLRIGYAVGCADLIRSLGVAISPKAFSPVAARVAIAALEESRYYLGRAHAALDEMRAVVQALRSQGWWVRETRANFYLVYAGADGPASSRLVSRLLEAGVQARDRGSLPCLAGFVRLTAGSPEDSEAVLRAFSGASPPPERPLQLDYTPKGTVAQVKGLTRRALAVLEAAGVRVWAQSGTMLGIARHSGMIPTDDDADLAYLRSSSEDPMAPLTAAFRDAGLILQRNRTDAYWQVGTNAPGETISPVHVDVFSYREVPGAAGPTYVLEDPRFRDEDPTSPEAHCNTQYTHEELYPLRPGKYYDMEILMPAQSEAVLRRALGPDCMSVIRARTSSGLRTAELVDLTPA